MELCYSMANTGDAGTLLVKGTINISEEREAFIVSLIDTDIFLSLMNHFNSKFYNGIIMVTKKRNQLINQVSNRIILK